MGFLSSEYDTPIWTASRMILNKYMAASAASAIIWSEKSPAASFFAPKREFGALDIRGG
jgi:hypothetical protein